jgi:hypothetical protein
MPSARPLTVDRSQLIHEIESLILFAQAAPGDTAFTAARSILLFLEASHLIDFTLVDPGEECDEVAT